MWKLTITQKKPAEFYGGTIDAKIEFVGKDINVLTLIIAKLSEHEGDIETSYNLEKVGVKNE